MRKLICRDCGVYAEREAAIHAMVKYRDYVECPECGKRILFDLQPSDLKDIDKIDHDTPLWKMPQFTELTTPVRMFEDDEGYDATLSVG